MSNTNPFIFLALAAFVYFLFQYIRSTRTARKGSNERESTKPEERHGPSLSAYQDIEPLQDFDWQTTEPMKLRPFKPTYHLTMGLETIPLSSLLQFDKTYLSRIKLRREIMHSHPKETLACEPEAEPATRELYEWLMGVYLPRRYPSCFSLVKPEKEGKGKGSPESDSKDQHPPSNDSKKPTHLLNKITNETIPLLAPSSPLKALHTISSQIDTDFLILLPKPTPSSPTPPPKPEPSPQQPTYHLRAFATTFPSGFSTLSKLSLPLSEIHSPVPQYGPKLGKSMDRFFARLERGKLVRRANWTITTTPELFTESGTHMHSSPSEPPPSDEERAAEIARQQANLKVEEMRLRCELQTLHRLEHSGALVFAFKTFQYGLEEVRDEGNGEVLAEATEGFARGSVPEMEVYKRAVVWGGVVREFLRGRGGEEVVE